LLVYIGAEIIFNSSGSHHELRKLSKRITLISDATSKVICFSDLIEKFSAFFYREELKNIKLS